MLTWSRVPLVSSFFRGQHQRCNQRLCLKLFENVELVFTGETMKTLRGFSVIIRNLPFMSIQCFVVK